MKKNYLYNEIGIIVLNNQLLIGVYENNFTTFRLIESNKEFNVKEKDVIQKEQEYITYKNGKPNNVVLPQKASIHTINIENKEFAIKDLYRAGTHLKGEPELSASQEMLLSKFLKTKNIKADYLTDISGFSFKLNNDDSTIDKNHEYSFSSLKKIQKTLCKRIVEEEYSL